MDIVIIKNRINKDELETIIKNNFGNMVKGVVDIDRKIIALGGSLHADAEEALLKNGSIQKYLWGFNIFSDKEKNARLEYTSFINIRPNDNNFSIELTDETLKNTIRSIVDQLIE